jgi:hypothetical protein
MQKNLEYLRYLKTNIRAEGNFRYKFFQIE